MQVADTFATYEEFSAVLTAEIACQKAVFRVHAAEIVAKYLKETLKSERYHRWDMVSVGIAIGLHLALA